MHAVSYWKHGDIYIIPGDDFICEIAILWYDFIDMYTLMCYVLFTILGV